jgi:large subunit ribosomal protein L6
VAKPVPEGLAVELPTNTQVVVRGADKQLVGQFAAEIRKLRPPSPYPHGTGIRYSDEEVRKKAGKTFTSIG